MDNEDSKICEKGNIKIYSWTILQRTPMDNSFATEENKQTKKPLHNLPEVLRKSIQ